MKFDEILRYLKNDPLEKLKEQKRQIEAHKALEIQLRIQGEHTERLRKEIRDLGHEPCA